MHKHKKTQKKYKHSLISCGVGIDNKAAYACILTHHGCFFHIILYYSIAQDHPVDYPKKLFSETTSDSLVSEDCWEVRPEKLLLHEVIGEGAFGVVRRGTLVPSKEVAVKMLKGRNYTVEITLFRTFIIFIYLVLPSFFLLLPLDIQFIVMCV